MNKKALKWVLFVFLLFVIALPGILNFDNGGNLFIAQAKAFLQGKLNIENFLYDSAKVGNNFYVPHPPVPAVILTPFVKVFGPSSTNTALIGFFLTVGSLFFFIKILNKLGIDEKYHIWLASALYLGTGYCLCLLWANQFWFFAHLTALFFIMAAINETFGKKRGWLIGLLFSCAFLSRQLALCLFPLFIIGIISASSSKNNELNKEKIINICSFGLICILFFGIYLYMNYLRFGNPLDAGYTHTQIAWDTTWLHTRLEKYGWQSPVYFFFNFVYLFLQGFYLRFLDPANPLSPIQLDTCGTSILAASPFVLCAFYAKWNKIFVIAAWISVCLILLNNLFFISTGFVQINTQRYSLELFPALMLLIAFGMQSINNNKLCKFAILYSIFLNFMALYFVPFYNNFISLN